MDTHPERVSNDYYLGRAGWLLLGFYLLMCLLNMREYIGGRFWAEEGRDFYVQLYNAPWTAIFTHTHHARLEFITNSIVYLSSLFPLSIGPLITTYLSLLIQLLPVVVLLGFRKQLSLHPLALGVFLVLLAGMPQANEVMANSINLHFHFTFLAALILILPDVSGKARYALRLLLLLCGLSGAPPNILLPIFFLKAIIDRRKEFWIHVGIMGATTLIQIGLLSLNVAESASREPSFNPMLTVFALFTQQILAPLYKIGFAAQIAAWLKDHLEATSLMMASLASFIAIYSLFIAWVLRSGCRPCRYLVLCIVILVLVTSLVAIGGTTSLITNGYGNGRYFYGPNAIFYLVLCFAFSRYISGLNFHNGFSLKDLVNGGEAIAPRIEKVFSCLSAGIAGTYLLMGLTTAVYGFKAVNTGPEWDNAYQQAVKSCDRNIAIWPSGWTMKLHEPVCNDD